MCHIKLSPAARLVLQYFSELYHELHDFRKKKLLKIKYIYFDFLYNLSLKHTRVGILILATLL